MVERTQCQLIAPVAHLDIDTPHMTAPTPTTTATPSRKQMHTGGWEIVRKHVCYIDKHQLLVLESGRDGQLEGSGRELW